MYSARSSGAATGISTFWPLRAFCRVTWWRCARISFSCASVACRALCAAASASAWSVNRHRFANRYDTNDWAHLSGAYSDVKVGQFCMQIHSQAVHCHLIAVNLSVPDNAISQLMWLMCAPAALVKTPKPGFVCSLVCGVQLRLIRLAVNVRVFFRPVVDAMAFHLILRPVLLHNVDVSIR